MIYPMKLKPVLKSYIWGGEKLAAKYGKDGGSVAESWEVAANASGSSVISGGEYDGMTLVDFLAAHPEALGTEAAKFEFFPVLVKLIDAASDLSVQVHPDDDYALAKEGQYGKTEMWYVVECEPGAGMYCGFKRKVTKEEETVSSSNRAPFTRSAAACSSMKSSRTARSLTVSTTTAEWEPTVNRVSCTSPRRSRSPIRPQSAARARV